MRVRKFVLMDGEPGAAGGGAAAAAGAGAAAEPGAGGASGAAAPGAAGEGGASALARPVPIHERIPEKFHVKKGEEFDSEASIGKVLEGYTALEQRMKDGGAPPKSAEEYAFEVPADLKDKGVALDDAKVGEFKKDAHAAGLSQKQFDLVMGRFLTLAPELMAAGLQNTTEATIASLDKAWGGEYDKQLGLASKAFDQLAGPEDKGKFDDIMRDPSIAYRMLAKIGAEMREGGAPPAQADAATSGEDIRTLLTSEAASNPKHADHKAVRAKIDAYYSKKYGDAPVS